MKKITKITNHVKNVLNAMFKIPYTMSLQIHNSGDIYCNIHNHMISMFEYANY